jgi:DNA polymerase-4
MGQFYVDMTGCERLHGHPLGVAFRVRRQMLDATELHVSIGIAATRLAARLASSVAKPQGILFVLPGQEASFLAPMPISVLSGVTPKTERQLLLLGIRRLGDLGRLNPETLRPVIGEQGIRWRSQALALDQAAVEGQTEKRICWETTFDSEVIDFEVLQQSLGELIAKACKKCREAGLKAHRVAVHLLYTDLQRVVRSRTLKPGTDLDLVVLNAAQAVLKHLYTRRAAVRLLGVTLSDFLREQAPCLPFDGGDALMRRRFYAGVDAVRDRFGFDSLKTGGVFALRRRLAPDNRMERSHDAQ